MPRTEKSKSPSGILIMPAGAVAAGLVGGISTMVCGTADQVRGYSRRDFLERSAMKGRNSRRGGKPAILVGARSAPQTEPSLGKVDVGSSALKGVLGLTAFPWT